MRRAWVLVVLAGCGRLGFEDQPGGGDAAVVDGSSATGDAGLTCLPSYSVCDDFEAPVVNTETWQVDSMIAIDTARAHRGASSLHVHMPAFDVGQGNYQFIADAKTVMTASTFWVRGWFWLSALPAGTNGLELITAELPGAAGDYVFVRSNRTTVYSQFNDTSNSSAVTAPVNNWFCVLFKVVRSTASTGSLEMSGDVPTVTLPNVRTDGAPPMDRINLGIGFSSTNVTSAQPAMDLWIDDVIIDDAALTCAD
jgi:hypothetical protein